MGSAKPGDLDVGVAGIDADSAFGVTFKHDDTLEDAQVPVDTNPNPNLIPNPNPNPNPNPDPNP